MKLGQRSVTSVADVEAVLGISLSTPTGSPVGPPPPPPPPGQPGAGADGSPSTLSSLIPLDEPETIDPAQWLRTLGFGFEEPESVSGQAQTGIEERVPNKLFAQVMFAIVAVAFVFGGIKGYDAYKKSQCHDVPGTLIRIADNGKPC